MQGKEFINENGIADGDCALCAVFEQASQNKDKLTKMQCCPICGSHNIVLYKEDSIISDGDNTCNINELKEYNYYNDDIYRCGDCHASLVQTFKPVQYNGSHDVYYTGGESFIISEKFGYNDKELRDIFNKEIHEFIERTNKGEDLDEWNLSTWLLYSLENYVAANINEMIKIRKNTWNN